jgi:hypothetical protein
MSSTPVTELREAIERMEVAYEFLISFAGEGVDRESVQSSTDQVNDYVTTFESALEDGHEAAAAVPDRHDEFDDGDYAAFVAGMEPEIEEARTVLRVLAGRDIITSAMADNINGMSVFQSVMMKFFFLDELTTHLEREADDE